MNINIGKEVAALQRMTNKELRGRYAEVFGEERTRLEHEWAQGDNVSTGDLRQALRKYRSFFDRMLAL